MKKWKSLNSQEIFSTRYFRLRVDECLLPDGRIMPRYFVMEYADWVQVVALDKAGRLILVKQYRHPGDGWFIEFPGGSTEPGANIASAEKPLSAAKRELREETGYAAKKWKYLGYHYPNPAILTNRCHVFLARDCVKVGELELDAFEDLEVCTMKPSQFMSHLRKSKKMHSLMLASYELARPYLAAGQP